MPPSLISFHPIRRNQSPPALSQTGRSGRVWRALWRRRRIPSTDDASPLVSTHRRRRSPPPPHLLAPPHSTGGASRPSGARHRGACRPSGPAWSPSACHGPQCQTCGSWWSGVLDQFLKDSSLFQFFAFMELRVDLSCVPVLFFRAAFTFLGRNIWTSGYSREIVNRQFLDQFL